MTNTHQWNYKKKHWNGEAISLDFDDAYQYVAAEKYTLTLISFDTDFDRTERGKKTPGEIKRTPI